MAVSGTDTAAAGKAAATSNTPAAAFRTSLLIDFSPDVDRAGPRKSCFARRTFGYWETAQLARCTPPTPRKGSCTKPAWWAADHQWSDAGHHIADCYALSLR